MRLEDLRRAIRLEWRVFGMTEGVGNPAFSLMPWEDDLYSRFLKPLDSVLVVGCGTGRDLVALLKRGYRVDGLDVVPACTDVARRNLETQGLRAELHTGDIETIPLPRTYDVFIFSWFCYSYIPQADSRIHVLRKVVAHLNPEGRILLSYVPRDPARRHLPVHVARLMARLSGSDWQPEYGDLIATSTRADVRGLITHYVHEFLPQELEDEARAAGLAVIFHQRGNEGLAVLAPRTGGQ